MSARTPTSGAVRTRTSNGSKVRRTFEPVRFDRRPDPEAVERIPLFYLDGVEYTMPAVIEPTDAIVWAGQVRIQPNEDVKRIKLLSLLCGDAAANALLADATMTQAQWDALGTIMQEHAFGPREREEPEGN